LLKPPYKRFLKNWILCFSFMGIFNGVLAQHTKPKEAHFQDIFGDLPIHDAASLSVLKKNENPEKKIHDNIFIKSFVSKPVCYVGEPILLSYQLFSALQNESEIYKLPSLSGSAILELSVVNEHPEYKEIKGKTYRVFNLSQFQLTPQSAGKFQIDTLAVSNTVRYRIDPDSTGHYEGIVYSKPMSIEVKPLPERGKPVGFSGAVGDFLLKVSVDSLRIAAGETDALHIEITGSGNFIPLSMPKINWPVNFDYFPAREKSNLIKNTFPPVGNQNFDILFVPQKGGRFSIPGLQIVFFNAAKGVYETSSSKPIEIIVLPAKATPADEKEIQVSVPAHHYGIWAWAALLLVAVLVLFIFIRNNKHD
jgi:hypothetical protein